MENEQNETLEEMFKRVTEEQKKQIDELNKKLDERDKLIKTYMTTPSNIKPKNEDNNGFTSDDVKEIIELVKNKRK